MKMRQKIVGSCWDQTEASTGAIVNESEKNHFPPPSPFPSVGGG